MSWKPRLIAGGKDGERSRPAGGAAAEGGPSDADLVQRVLQGLPAEGPSRLPGHDAFGALVERHQAQVVRLARNLVRDPDEARDVAQDTFLRAYRSLASFRPELSFRAWLLKIAVNAARDHVARRGAWRLRPLDDAAEVAAAGCATSEVEDALLIERVRVLVAQLPAREREVFVLRELEGLDAEEVADVLGLEPPTVRRHLARARLHLRTLLEHGGAENLSGD